MAHHLRDGKLPPETPNHSSPNPQTQKKKMHTQNKQNIYINPQQSKKTTFYFYYCWKAHQNKNPAIAISHKRAKKNPRRS